VSAGKPPRSSAARDILGEVRHHHRRTIRELGSNAHIAAHYLDCFSRGGEQQITALFETRSAVLSDPESLGNAGLRGNVAQNFAFQKLCGFFARIRVAPTLRDDADATLHLPCSAGVPTGDSRRWGQRRYSKDKPRRSKGSQARQERSAPAGAHRHTFAPAPVHMRQPAYSAARRREAPTSRACPSLPPTLPPATRRFVLCP
jgi:hypothetical protein